MTLAIIDLFSLSLFFSLLLSSPTGVHGHSNFHGVSFDGRSLIINGRRELLFSGSIHYPRSTPQMWPDLIAKAKKGGLNAIQTYVFWSIHEPQPGQLNFKGRYDLIKFIKLIHQNGLYVTLRIGPFIEAEWNFGGLPFGLKEVKNITFRSDNPAFKHHMKKFTHMIASKMKEEKLFASQGGPIIMSQIENEYNNVAPAFKEDGTRYIQWAGKMAVGLDTGVPWVMCKQEDAPISTCNGRNCGDTFKGPRNASMPILWTENWTAQYRVFGDPPSQRSAEDLAYSVACFLSKNGTLVNYYMYHGGTNFGRTSSSFVTTRYYDEAPLDEYGLLKEPKWGHIKDLHSALNLCRKALLWGTRTVRSLGRNLEARVYEKPGSKACAAFLVNKNPRVDATVIFRGERYFLPHHSISILPDCKSVVFNSQRVNAQHNARTYHPVKEAEEDREWHMYNEKVPTFTTTSIRSKGPMELMNLTKDKTDFLWYTTSFNLEKDDLSTREDIQPVIQVSSLGHALHAFVNDIYIGSGHGNNIDKSFSFFKPAKLKVGTNHVSLLAMTVGLPDSGAFLERRMAGIHRVSILGLNTGTLDLSFYKWGHQIGLEGEKLRLYKQRGLHRVQWTDAKKKIPLAWYKRYFDAPSGDDPVAVDMSAMGKGMVWINGQSIGRYWVSFLSPLGLPSQSMYHVPRSFLKPSGNLIVVMEETGGNPEDIAIITVRRDNICAIVSNSNPAPVSFWGSRERNTSPTARLQCADGKIIRSVAFASFGNPKGSCGELELGSCHAPSAIAVAKKACLGKASCELTAGYEAYGADASCPGTTNTLAVQAVCTREKH